MQRRSFFNRVFSAAVAFFGARRVAAQTVAAQTVEPGSLDELAAVVLPASLGRTHIDKIAADFVLWIRDYKPGVPMASGYGYPRTQVVGPNPSANYAAQLRALGSPITRESVAKALDDAKIDRIPQRPNGKHVAADLLSFFYGSSEGEDFLYGVAIRRDDCRGLADSAQRPARLT
jgi:hypothetical protein